MSFVIKDKPGSVSNKQFIVLHEDHVVKPVGKSIGEAFFTEKELLASFSLPQALLNSLEQQTATFGDEGEICCFVGEISLSDAACFVVALPANQPLDDSRFDSLSLRACLVEVDEQTFQIFSRASQLVGWVKTHRFCGVCGEKTRPASSDMAQVCSACEMRFYPRIAPCVIGLVSKGEECLLARSYRMKSGYYSTIAGFVEAGESAEEAFRREVKEEVGIEITNVRYLYSQAWPFPGQLMLGFVADYAAGDIVRDEKEIEDAGWYHWQDLPPIPPPQTISGKIIREFVERQS